MKLSEEFSQLLPRLGNISIKLPFANIYAGSRKSSQRGNSEEFSDFSSYTAGDDIRRIDWNSYARSGKLFIKNNYDEKKAELNIFIDTSRSMNFGKKADYVRIACAVLCYMARTDSVTIYADNGRYKQTGNFFSTLKFIESVDFSGDNFRADFSRGLNVVMTDFLYDGIDKKFPKKPYSSVSFIHIADKLEIDPETDGFSTLCDMETGKELNADDDITESYKEEFFKLRKRVYEYCAKSGFKYSFVTAHEDPVKILERI